MTKLLSFVAVLAGVVFAPQVFAGEQNCGSDRKETCCQASHCRLLCIHRHHGSCNCQCKPSGGESQSRGLKLGGNVAPAPRAMITESVPAMMFQPQFIAMPVMYGGGGNRGFDGPQPQSRAMEPSCSDSKDRINTLEERVEALDLRIRTIQRSVEIQTQILEQMKANGLFEKKQ